MRRAPTAFVAALACASCSLALDFDRAQLPPSPARDGAAEVGVDGAADAAGADTADESPDGAPVCEVGAHFCPARGACAACCAHGDCGSGSRCCGGACCRGAACDPRCPP